MATNLTQNLKVSVFDELGIRLKNVFKKEVWC